jgi:hypothetical protein
MDDDGYVGWPDVCGVGLLHVEAYRGVAEGGYWGAPDLA